MGLRLLNRHGLCQKRNHATKERLTFWPDIQEKKRKLVSEKVNVFLSHSVYMGKNMTDGGAGGKVTGYPKSNAIHPLGNSSQTIGDMMQEVDVLVKVKI